MPLISLEISTALPLRYHEARQKGHVSTLTLQPGHKFASLALLTLCTQLRQEVNRIYGDVFG